jgi:hypothetical protein
MIRRITAPMTALNDAADDADHDIADQPKAAALDDQSGEPARDRRPRHYTACAGVATQAAIARCWKHHAGANNTAP